MLRLIYLTSVILTHIVANSDILERNAAIDNSFPEFERRVESWPTIIVIDIRTDSIYIVFEVLSHPLSHLRA